jgi:hypothetical protein
MNIEPPTEPPEDTSGRDSPDRAAPETQSLDERLSARIDGVVDGDADAGATGAGDPARLRALEAARDLLAVPPPPLDDLTRRRLVRTALDAAPASRHRDLRRLSRVSAAAAVVVLVVLAGWALKGPNHSSSKAALAPRRATNAPTGAPLDLHDVSDPAVLRQRVEAALGSSAPSADQLATATTAAHSSTTVAQQRTQPPPTAQAPTTPAGEIARQSGCLSTVDAPAGTDPGVLGIATYRGQSALVIVARGRSQITILVVASADCRVLTSQFIRE